MQAIKKMPLRFVSDGFQEVNNLRGGCAPRWWKPFRCACGWKL